MSFTQRNSWLWALLNKSKQQLAHHDCDCQHTTPLRLSTDETTIAGDDEQLLEKDIVPVHRIFNQYHSHIPTVCLVFLAIVLSMICSALIILIINLNTLKHLARQSPPNPAQLSVPFTTKPRLRHCGTNAEEARSLGCKFQIWSYSWVPPECYDEVLVQEWLDMRDWEYYDDRYGKGEVVNFTTQVLPGERLLYSTWGQHYWHCAFTWRKFLRAALGSGVGITDQDLDYHHANHCQDTIRNKPDYRPWDENDIQLTVGFHSC